MKFFVRCVGVFVLLWIITFFIYENLWSGAHAADGAFLFGGATSIVLTVFYGMIDEVWIQHGGYTKTK